MHSRSTSISSETSANSTTSAPNPERAATPPPNPIFYNGTMDFLRRKGLQMWDEQIKATGYANPIGVPKDMDEVPQPTWRQVCEKVMDEGWNLKGEVWQWH